MACPFAYYLLVNILNKIATHEIKTLSIHCDWYSYGKNPDTDSVLIQMQDIPAGSKFCQCLKASTLMKLDAKEEAAEILKNVSVGGNMRIE